MASPTLAGSASLFSFRGIRVYVHWTFLLLVGWVVISGLGEGADVRGILREVSYLLIVFICVVLHEYGHALTAQRFGIRTRDITLLPIGGIASLERMPEEPRQELLITIAGPLVNLVIAILAFVVLLVGTGIHGLRAMTEPEAFEAAGVTAFILTANLGLFLFNLIPAFPMDGGRILRSSLAFFMPRLRATRIAVRIGRLFALGFIVAAFTWSQPMLAIIGIFIYLAAGAEERGQRQQSVLQGVRVRQVMRTSFWSMPVEATVRQAVEGLLQGGDQDMVLLDRSVYRGVITRSRLISALRDHREDDALGSLEIVGAPVTHPDAEARTVFDILMTGRWPLMPVIESGVVIGVMEAENLAEFLMVREAQAGVPRG